MNSYLQFFYELNNRSTNEKYLHGIPNLNKEFFVGFIPDKYGVQFLDAKSKSKKFYLNKKDLTKISIEDQTTIEKRVGFKRLLLVGIFALAWKKKTEIPLSFIIFEFNNEFNENQEMIIQSDQKTGFQDFTNLKHNLLKFWSEADNNPNFGSDYKSFIQKKENLEKRNFKIAIFLVVGFILIWIIKKIINYDKKQI